MAEDLLMQLPPEGSLTTLPGGFTSDAAEAKVVGRKTLLQDALRHHPSAPGTGVTSFPLRFVSAPRAAGAGMTAGRRRARAGALPRAREGVASHKDISGAPRLLAFLCEQFPGKLKPTPLHYLLTSWLPGLSFALWWSRAALHVAVGV